jgi:cysteine desulfurase
MTSRIYLDNNATTGVDPRVLEAMLIDLSPTPANPSSVHYFGQEARNRLAKARQTIAEFLQVKPTEILFTSGGTESLNMMLRGILQSPGHIISSNIEHSALFNTIDHLREKGSEVSYLPTGPSGRVNPQDVYESLRKDTRVIALGAVNSETGVKNDIESIAKIAQDAKVPFIVDGVALLGKELFTIPEGVSAMAFSGHKLHAPKGIGFCYLRSSLKFPSLLTGGDQEFSKRAGTENLSGILGLAKAVELLKTELPSATQRIQSLRDHLEAGLKQKIGNVLVNGTGPRICNTSNLAFPDIDGESLLIQLDLTGIAVSHGSACSSGALEPSRVLLNMGLNKKLAASSLRFSLSRWTTKEEIDRTIDTVSSLVLQMKKL